jgi:hypothetical protein
VIASHSHRKTLTGVLACAIAYVFVLQATLAATLSASLPPATALTLGELCLSGSADAHIDNGNGVDAEHVKAASRCSLCLVPGFGLAPSPTPAVVVVRTALGIAFEPSAPARIFVADAPSPHRARAPPPRA